MNTTLTIRLPFQIKKELSRLSREEKTPISDIVRESLARYVATRRFRKLKNMVMPFAEAQGLLTDDDIFKALK